MSTPDARALPAPSQPFDDWRNATAALRAGKARGMSETELTELSAEVVRTRNALTMDRRQAGLTPPDDVLEHLLSEGRPRQR